SGAMPDSPASRGAVFGLVFRLGRLEELDDESVGGFRGDADCDVCRSPKPLELEAGGGFDEILGGVDAGDLDACSDDPLGALGGEIGDGSGGHGLHQYDVIGAVPNSGGSYTELRQPSIAPANEESKFLVELCGGF